MTDRSCPYFQHCHNSGSCDDCEYHLKFDSFKKKICRLEKKIEALQTELRSIRGIDDSRLKVLLDAEREGRIVVLPCKKNHKPARFCDPAICDHCIYLREGDFACIKDESDAVIVIDEWKSTDDFMRCMKGKQK